MNLSVHNIINKYFCLIFQLYLGVSDKSKDAAAYLTAKWVKIFSFIHTIIVVHIKNNKKVLFGFLWKDS